MDDDPETRAGTISADCPPGEHVVSVGLYSAETVELARASVAFTVLERPEPTVGVSLAPAGPVAEGTAIAVTGCRRLRGERPGRGPEHQPGGR